MKSCSWMSIVLFHYSIKKMKYLILLCWKIGIHFAQYRKQTSNLIVYSFLPHWIRFSKFTILHFFMGCNPPLESNDFIYFVGRCSPCFTGCNTHIIVSKVITHFEMLNSSKPIFIIMNGNEVRYLYSLQRIKRKNAFEWSSKYITILR